MVEVMTENALWRMSCYEAPKGQHSTCRHLIQLSKSWNPLFHSPVEGQRRPWDSFSSLFLLSDLAMVKSLIPPHLLLGECASRWCSKTPNLAFLPYVPGQGDLGTSTLLVRVFPLQAMHLESSVGPNAQDKFQSHALSHLSAPSIHPSILQGLLYQQNFSLAGEMSKLRQTY